MYRLIKRDVYWNHVREVCVAIIQGQKIEDERALNDAFDKIIDKNGLQVNKNSSLFEKIKIILTISEKKIGPSGSLL
jgi:hypothetical protein